ncbi:hypothetical protein YUMDRAFT_00960 [Streptomyces sp. OspMP-M45]|nr:hypothetical protein YUMDRAFT_00960 [Streptomyces sp. OspMP-M45]
MVSLVVRIGEKMATPQQSATSGQGGMNCGSCNGNRPFASAADDADEGALDVAIYYCPMDEKWLEFFRLRRNVDKYNALPPPTREILNLKQIRGRVQVIF